MTHDLLFGSATVEPYPESDTLDELPLVLAKAYIVPLLFFKPTSTPRLPFIRENIICSPETEDGVFMYKNISHDLLKSITLFASESFCIARNLEFDPSQFKYF